MTTHSVKSRLDLEFTPTLNWIMETETDKILLIASAVAVMSPGMIYFFSAAHMGMFPDII